MHMSIHICIHTQDDDSWPDVWDSIEYRKELGDLQVVGRLSGTALGAHAMLAKQLSGNGSPHLTEALIDHKPSVQQYRLALPAPEVDTDVSVQIYPYIYI